MTFSEKVFSVFAALRHHCFQTGAMDRPENAEPETRVRETEGSMNQEEKEEEDGEEEVNLWALHQAAHAGDVHGLRVLLEDLATRTLEEQSEALARKDEAGLTPLHWAARMRRPRAIGLLADAAVSIVTRIGATVEPRDGDDDATTSTHTTTDAWRGLNEPSEDGLTALQELIGLACSLGEDAQPCHESDESGPAAETNDISASPLACVSTLFHAASSASMPGNRHKRPPNVLY